MTGSGARYYYPNKMGRIILLGMEEVLGRNGLNAVLNTADLSNWIHHYPANNLDREFDFADLSAIQTALEKLYGPRGGQGVALRAGRASFKYGLREFGPMLGLTDLAFRLLPLSEKLYVGSGLFADIFNQFSDQRVSVADQESKIVWRIDRCPICWGRQSDTPVCHLAVGILQEALYWVSSGKYFCVEEIGCIACGDPACTIVIDKQPLE